MSKSYEIVALKVECYLSRDIKEVAQELIELAIGTNLLILVNFNGVELSITKEMSVDEVRAQYIPDEIENEPD
jgi:hypothetical protein